MNDNVIDHEKTLTWPLWKTALRELRALPEFGYGLTLDIEWFERALGAAKDTATFAFGLMELRARVEDEDGYYLRVQTVQDDETSIRHETVQIPNAADHEDVCSGFESRMRSYASRAIELRRKTLGNDKADLTEAQKGHMEKAAEIAATRMVLLRREKSVCSYIRKHAPKLLDK
jgi:hypothetical protein